MPIPHPQDTSSHTNPTTNEPSREARVLQAVAALVDTLLADFDVVDLLTELTERCTALLDVASAGLLLADPRDRLHLMAATSGKTHDLELFQLQAEQGPCLDCYTTGKPLFVPDLAATVLRWPRFTAAALDAGFASVHVIPLRAGGTVLGAMGLFGTRSGDLTGTDLLLGQTLAHIACVAILKEHPTTIATVLPPLRTALLSRIVVEQAKGFLHESLGIPMHDAFTVLRHYAHTHGQHMTDVSRQLITTTDTTRPILTAMTHLLAAHHSQPPDPTNSSSTSPT